MPRSIVHGCGVDRVRQRCLGVAVLAWLLAVPVIALGQVPTLPPVTPVAATTPGFPGNPTIITPEVFLPGVPMGNTAPVSAQVPHPAPTPMPAAPAPAA